MGGNISSYLSENIAELSERLEGLETRLSDQIANISHYLSESRDVEEGNRPPRKQTPNYTTPGVKHIKEQGTCQL